eukprot:PhM_4_TR16092/c0_g1_i2/m.90160
MRTSIFGRFAKSGKDTTSSSGDSSNSSKDSYDDNDNPYSFSFGNKTSANSDAQSIRNHVSVTANTSALGTTEQPLPLGFYLEVRIESMQSSTSSLTLSIISVKAKDGARFDFGDADYVSCSFSSTGNTPPFPRLAASDTFGCGVTSHGKIFMTLNGAYLGSPSPPVVFNPQTSKCKLNLVAPVGGVAFTYIFDRPGHARLMFDPTMPREPPMKTTTTMTAPPQPKLSCGSFIGVTTVNPITGCAITLENTDPDALCRPYRESQVQLLPPIGSDNPHPYVEMTVTSLGQAKEATVALGVAPQFANRQSFEGLPGWARGTIGVHSDDGYVYVSSGRGLAFLPHSVTVGDVLGCGVDATDNVYYTLNGTYVGKASPMPPGIDACFTVGLDPQTCVCLTVAPPFKYSVSSVSERISEQGGVVSTRDTLLEVFSFLTPEELLRVGGTCVAWYDAVADDTNWLPRLDSSSVAQLRESTNLKLWYFHERRRSARNTAYDAALDELVRCHQPTNRVKKPVIYVYGPPGKDKTCVDVTVQLTDPDGKMLFVHPAPTAGSSNIITWEAYVPRSAGGTVPYLFWEAVLPQLNQQAQTIITTTLDLFSRTVPPLLRKRGLSSVEISDFISFWLPSLRADANQNKHKYVEIGFLTQDTIEDRIATLHVRHSVNKLEGASDEIVIHRVYATFRLLDAPRTCVAYGDAVECKNVDNFKTQRDSVFSRGGIFVVEWGGVVLT